MQTQLRLLSGRTAFVEGVLDVAALRERVAALEGIPADLLRLTRSARELHDASPLLHDDGAPVAVLLRLEGGKGGFGAMLRTAGAKGIKTTNFDMCRDLNGRRLKHVNAEAALREWDAKAEERKLKKQQDAAMNAKPAGPALVGRFDDEEYEEQLEGARNRVSDALAVAMAASTSTAEGAAGSSSSGPTADAAAVAGEAAPGADGKAALASAAAAGEAGEAASSSSGGKRKLEAAAPAASKTSKVAWDPLAMLEGDGEDSEEGDEE